MLDAVFRDFRGSGPPQPPSDFFNSIGHLQPFR